MTDKITLAVLFGGASSEHEVSRMSATSVLNHLDPNRYDIIPIGITKDGRWLRYAGETKNILNGDWERDESACIPVVPSPVPAHHGFLQMDERIGVLPVDVIFPVLHGKNGEDGTIQGLFDLARVPYVGCGVLASADCMDKEVTHVRLAAAGIPMARFVTVYRSQLEEFDMLEASVLATLSYPVFVKPANAGSSVGVSRADGREELRAALTLAFQHDEKVLVEETLRGREVECAVLGNISPIASSTGEIVPCNAFYDYEAKYLDDASQLFIPARIRPEEEDAVRSLAIKAFRTMGCTGLSRVDFFVTEDRGPVLNEINTLPGFTSISMYPKLIQHTGVTYAQLLDRLIELALERFSK